MEKYTDQEFFYKQTPVNYDGIAKFTSIKGNTLGWNQLIQNGNFADTSIWSVTGSGSSFTVSNNIATINASGAYDRIQQNVEFINGHKYLIKADVKKTNANDDVRLYYGNHVGGGNYVFTNTTDWQTLSVIKTASESVTSVYPNVEGATAKLTWQQRNMMIIDLTQMGLDITDPSDFTSLFPLSYYSYNQGSLLSFMGNGIKTTGKNLFDESLISQVADIGYVQIYVGDGTFEISTTTPNNGQANVFLLSGYATSGASTANNGAWDGRTRQVISNGGYVTVATRTAGTPLINPKDYETILYKYNGETVPYEPYTSHTTNLPIATYFPTGMKSAGNVYDELTESKAITRVRMVDMGTLTWLGGSWNGHYRYYASVPNIKTSQDDYTSGLLCSKFQVSSYPIRGGTQENNVIAKYIGNVYVATSDYTSANNFKTAMNGVYLYYELATETETDAEDIFYKFYGNGTEQLLPVNGSSPTTSYLIADIEYYDSTEGDSLYRRFWLINGDGERWDLTDKEFKSFLNNPTGLGFRKTIEVTRYGEKANKNNEVYDFPQPSGELLFYDTYNSTRYDKYNKFIRFLMSQPITLYYMIPVSYISGIANIFTLNCDVTEVQKTESKTDHILTSSIVFNGLGFYEGDEISVNGTTDTYTLTNGGDFPVGFEITVEGTNMETPYITLSQDGELYGEAKFEGSEGTGYGGISFSHVYLNSNDGEQSLELKDQTSALLPNPLNYQDLSISNGSIYVTFIKLAKGVSELSIGMESGTISNVNIKYSPKYRSV